MLMFESIYYVLFFFWIYINVLIKSLFRIVRGKFSIDKFMLWKVKVYNLNCIMDICIFII